jgi:ER membrane protein complex subunit 7
MLPPLFAKHPSFVTPGAGPLLLVLLVGLLAAWSNDNLAVVAAAAAAAAADSSPTTTITGRLQFPDKSPFNMTGTKVTLNHQDYVTYTKPDGTFSIYNVPPGIHLLDVQSTTHHFSQVKIQLLKEAMSEPKCLEYAYPGANKQVLDCAKKDSTSSSSVHVTLTTVAMYDYFEKRSGFSIFSILKNPMILMMVFSVGIMYFMPQMMEGLDPEEKARMKKQMEMQQDPSKMISSLWEGLSGQPSSTDEATSFQPAAIAAGTGAAKKQARSKIKK